MGADPSPKAIEVIMARHMVTRALYVGPALILLFGLTRGWEGAWSAAIGIGVVIANFLLAGAILSISSRISLQAYHAAALLGFVLRLGIFVALVLVIAAAVPVDRLAFGISAVIAYLALLVLEALAVSKGEERDLIWTK